MIDLGRGSMVVVATGLPIAAGAVTGISSDHLAFVSILTVTVGVVAGIMAWIDSRIDKRISEHSKEDVARHQLMMSEIQHLRELIGRGS